MTEERQTVFVAAVRILRAPYPIDRDFDYRVPEYFEKRVSRGSLVTVPFGRSNRREIAICISVREMQSEDVPKPLKSIQEVLPDGYLVLCDEEGRVRQYAFKEVAFVI